ncbi:sulfatase family protein [Roseibacillus persicicus]|nr:arylsulfatase [Roseibacillus persicicus]
MKLLPLFLASLTVSLLAERPNIVFIMADDVGLGDLSYHVREQLGKKPVVETPNLDALAKESLWFTDGHSATSLCSPTRYCVMSGNNNYRSNAPWGVWGTFRETAFREGEATLGTVVRDAGYSTGFVGKWHLGSDFRDKKTGRIYRGTDNGDLSGKVDLTRMTGNGPRTWGFDYDFTLPCGVQGPIYLAYENREWFPLQKNSEIVFLDKNNAKNSKDLSSKGPGMGDSQWDAREIAELVSRKAADFIAAQEKDKPFFLYYCTPSVHLPHCPPEQFEEREVKGTTPSAHLDMVVALDLEIKRIIEALKGNGYFENTLIVFTSDNGGLLSDKNTIKSGHRSSGGWAKGKNAPEEGGHRVPFFAFLKDKIEPGFSAEPVVNQDMLATCAALVGTGYPDNQAMDSNNLLPLLTGEGEYQPREFLMQQAGALKEVHFRKGDWKIIIQSDNQLKTFEPIALYNLKNNPSELPEKNQLGNPAHKETASSLLEQYLTTLRSGVRTVPLPLKGSSDGKVERP